jgi:tetratricopeptide (TPR) repeat protein
LEQVISVEARPPRQIDDCIPRELERICLKSLSKGVTDRYSTALDLGDELRTFLSESRAGQPSPPVDTISHQHTAPSAFASARQFCLKGRYYWNKRTEEGLRRSVASFYQALDEEPTCASAWVGLADAYHQLGLWGHTSPTRSCPRAKSAALKAIQLDAALGEAHTALAVILKDYEWDFIGAERTFQRALELDPNHALSHQWYGECLACMGRHAEAISELQHAQDLDPLSININTALGRHGYFFAGEFDRAIDQLRKTIDTDPAFWITHSFLGWVYLFDGNSVNALNAFEAARHLDDNPETLVGLGYALATSGARRAAMECLGALTELAQHRYVAPVGLGLLSAALGESNCAFDWLEKACDDHSQWLSEIHVDPAFDPLRSEPRFAEILRRMNIKRCGSKEV